MPGLTKTLFKCGLALISMVAVLSGCAMAPLSNLYTARTIGKGNIAFTGGFESSVNGGGGLPVFKADYGAMENFDVGVIYELANTGILAKYAFVQKKEGGISAAATFGFGALTDGGYWSLGGVVSDRLGFFEPYFSAKFDRVSRGSSQFSVTSIGAFQAPSTTFDYLYFTLGSALWMSEKIGLLVEYDFFGTLNTSTTFPGPGFLSAGLTYRLN